MPKREKFGFPLPITIIDEPANHLKEAKQIVKLLKDGDYKGATGALLQATDDNLSEYSQFIMNCFEFPSCQKGDFKGRDVSLNKVRTTTFLRRNGLPPEFFIELKKRMDFALPVIESFQSSADDAKAAEAISKNIFLNRLFIQLGDRTEISMQNLLERDLHKVDDDIRIWSELANIDGRRLYKQAPQVNRKVFTPEISIIPNFEEAMFSGEDSHLMKAGFQFEFPASYTFGGFSSGFGLIHSKQSPEKGLDWYIADSIVTLDPAVLSRVAKFDISLLEDLAHLFRATAHDHIHTCVFHPYFYQDSSGELTSVNPHVKDDHSNWFGNMGGRNVYAMEYEHHAAVTKLAIWDEQIKHNPKQKQDLIDLSVRYLGKVKAFLHTENNSEMRSRLAEYLVCVGTYPVFGALDPNGADMEPIKHAIQSIGLPASPVSLEPLIHKLNPYEDVPDLHGEQVKILKGFIENGSRHLFGLEALGAAMDELGMMQENAVEPPKLSGYDLVRFRILMESLAAYEDTHKRRTIFDGSGQKSHVEMTRGYDSAIGQYYGRQ